MPSKQVDPETIDVSQYNERQTFDPDSLDELVDSVERSGVVEPPLVTPTDEDTLAAYVGQRRVAAACEADLDEITVIVNSDISDEDALIASITENTDLFSEDVSPGDRGQAVQTLWELMGGSGTPVFSHVAGKLGVSVETVRNWYEPMRDEWSDTVIDPTTESDADDETGDFFSGEGSLGERSLSEVRRMSDSKDEAERAAETASALGATQRDLSDAKEKVDSDGLPADKAIEDVVSGPNDDEKMEVSVAFRGPVTKDVQELAAQRGQTPETIIREAVEQYVDSTPKEDTSTPKPMSDSL